eukprot:g2432.t1
MGCAASVFGGSGGGASSLKKASKIDDDVLPSEWSDKYTVHDQIGQGMSGKVYRVTSNENKEELANKVMPLDGGLLPDEIEDMRRECRLLRDVSHPQIIKFVDTAEEKKRLYLVTELLRGKELFEYITTRTKYLESDARAVTKALLLAIKYLHDRNIVHRDIKPENMILAKPNDVESMKLIDFGLARTLKDPQFGIKKAAGTPGYLPPEALRVSSNYGLPADIWAVGIVAYIMLCGYPPFYGDSDIALFRSIRNDLVEFDSQDWSCQSAGAKDFVRKLLEKDPARRLTADECLKHPWIMSTEVTEKNMAKTLNNIKSLVAKRRLKKSIKAVVFTNRVARMRKMSLDIAKSLDDSADPAVDEKKGD